MMKPLKMLNSSSCVIRETTLSPADHAGRRRCVAIPHPPTSMFRTHHPASKFQAPHAKAALGLYSDQAGQVILHPVPSTERAASSPLTSWVTLNRSSLSPP